MSPRRPAVPLVLFGLLLLATSGAGCAQAPADRASPPARTSAANAPLAQVDSLGVPARIAPTDTLIIHLTGTVGPNGCYSLAGIDTERTDHRITLRPLVRPPASDDQMCTMALVPLDATHRVSPPFSAGTLTVTVPQNNRPAVTATVEVTDAE